MISLLDVNVLVALFDADHVNHEAAHRWFGENRQRGWATCPLTENGLVRIISNPGYPGRRTAVPEVVDRLAAFRASGGHSFWSDVLSLCQDHLFDFSHVGGYRQLTDVYLLALAVFNEGCLVTFDRRIRANAVVGAAGASLIQLGR